MKFDEFDQYSENLLLGQYEISEIISHELMKGEVREDFLISTLESCSDPKPKFVKGTVSDGVNDAGQLDIILCRPNSFIRRLGSQCYIEKKDSLCVVEVKGNCTGRDLKRAEEKAKTIQALQGEEAPLYGIVCYRVDLAELTVMNRFGYSFDRATNTYFDNATIQNESERDWRDLEYPNLDFFVSLEGEKKIFLRRYDIAPGKRRFIRLTTTPLIKELFSLMRGLWLPVS